MESKYILLAHFLLNAHQEAHRLEKWKLRAWNLGQIFEIELFMVGQCHCE